MDHLGDWQSRRADARRNHERVLAAAAEVFTEHGLDGTIPQVAARAGVGKATVYRSYPTKADLVRALAQVHIDWLKTLMARAAVQAETDAYAALEAMLYDVADRVAENALMLEVLDGTNADLHEDDQVAQQSARMIALGREQGRFAADITSTDLQVLVSGFSRALYDREIRDKATWRRYARLTVAALRP